VPGPSMCIGSTPPRLRILLGFDQSTTKVALPVLAKRDNRRGRGAHACWRLCRRQLGFSRYAPVATSQRRQMFHTRSLDTHLALGRAARDRRRLPFFGQEGDAALDNLASLRSKGSSVMSRLCGHNFLVANCSVDGLYPHPEAASRNKYCQLV